MGLVLWIDANTFATELLEKIFKKKALPFYTIPNVQDFVYIVEDLRPEVIVLDTKTAIENLEAFKGQYSSIKHLPFILVDHNNELPFIEKVRGEFKRPFDPFQVPQMINQILQPN